MSGCADVCIRGDYDGYNAFYSASTPKARKPHHCCECHDVIPAGAQYERANGKTDGDFWSESTCLVCCEIRAAFVCGAFTFTTLWEEIREWMFPVWNEKGAVDCLAKLTTLEAREKCRVAYAKWQGEEGR